ncbi:MAG: ribonuclease T [Proteobacteria bacterium]|nr:ribonuclease T [Pseudomonadota bacterium]
MLKNRFRKYLPVIVDLETGGFNPEVNPILEIALQFIDLEENGFVLGESVRYHLVPADGLILNKEALEFTKIELNHPLRNAVTTEEALKSICKIVNKKRSEHECSRAILALGAAFTGQTVLARIAKELNINYDNDLAHSASYDAEITAKIFCILMNRIESN